MQSKATTVPQYLDSLPDDRRAAIAAVRKVILKNLDKDYEEGMQYGMIGYYVPHRIFPSGYHCDPRQPLPFVALGSQKNHMAVYMMGIYGDAPLRHWLETEWKKTGKRIDIGKSCIRFKKLDDLPIELIGEAVRRIPAQAYIARYVETRDAMNSTKASKKPAGNAAPKKKTTKKRAKKTAPKRAARKTVSR